jgi:hypothetical protein
VVVAVQALLMTIEELLLDKALYLVKMVVIQL